MSPHARPTHPTKECDAPVEEASPRPVTTGSRARAARLTSSPISPNHRSRLDENIAIKSAVHSFEKTDDLRRAREARERAAEERQLEQLYLAHKEKELRARARAEEEAIVDALESRKKEASKRQLLVKQVSDNSQELRELKEKLRCAEVNFERSLQMEEAAMLKERDDEYDAAIHSVMEQQRVKAVFEEERAMQAKRKERAASREVLAGQIEEKKAMQEEARAEYLKEREQVDAVARAIQEEDEAERLRKAQKVKDTKAWVAKFLELREDLREQERRRLLEEEAQIARFAAEIERRQKATEGMREAQQAEKDRILEKLGKEKEENDRRRDEMEELINRLYFEEQEEKHRLAAKEKAARRVAMERDVKESNEQQRRIKEAIRVREAEQEQEFRQVMLEKFAEEDRVEQMNAQRRRMKMQEHKREVERLAAVKKAMHEEQMAREEEEAEAILAAEAADAAIVEGERKRLLMEHAARLKDFLPKGVLASGEDLDLINTVSSRLGEMSMTGTSRAGTRAAGSKAFAM